MNKVTNTFCLTNITMKLEILADLIFDNSVNKKFW